MSRREKPITTNTVMAIGFFVILWLPLAGTFFSLGVSESDIEKRVLEPAPKLEDIITEGLDQFCGQFNKFFNDRIAFREWLITANNVFRYLLFRTSSSERVTIGKDGWLFYSTAVKDFRSRKVLSARRLSDTQRILEQRRDWLAERGIKYLFLVAPNKTSIYPEFLPDYVQRQVPESKLDQLKNHLEKNSKLHMLDLRPALHKAKEAQPVYHRTDTHWNDNGALIAYQLIIAALAKRSSYVQPAMTEFNTTTLFDHPGDLSRLLTLDLIETENILRLNPKSGFSAKKIPFNYPKYRSIFTKEQQDKKLLKLLVFGDSFIHGTKLKDLLAEHFQRAVFIQGTRDFFDAELVKSEDPDIVIQENVERFLILPFQANDFGVSSKGNPRTGKKLLSINPASKYQQIRPMRDISLARHETYLLIRATGKDPHFQLPAFDFPPQKGITLELIMQSPADTKLQLFYLVQGVTKYSEQNSITKAIRKGRNTLRLSLPRNDLRGRLRMDPGRLPGQYHIYSLHIYAEDKTK